MGVVMFWRGFARKTVRLKKIRGAEQKPGLKPPPLVVDSPVLANFLDVSLCMHYTGMPSTDSLSSLACDRNSSTVISFK